MPTGLGLGEGAVRVEGVHRFVQHAVVAEAAGTLAAHTINATVLVAALRLHEVDTVGAIPAHHLLIPADRIDVTGGDRSLPVVDQMRGRRDAGTSEKEDKLEHLQKRKIRVSDPGRSLLVVT